ncbi:S phase cyclin A-associated protein in the endoplasmic reticulum isoform X4 [Dermacentor andersoni]|uniref:S phase cyclin A-associated protein in the endoplasmic reticulum isoform X4 n=1 Tax=Dermacentor andersoni TaxID=34620 RepID=UPI002416BE22|nr:S phase cyclin A-associated protein in the endoplasmic reticulum-like isoform X4 [Dermacentor andersoni]
MTSPSVFKPPIPQTMGASPNSVRGSSKLRARSSSAGRGPDKGLRARYWAYLFENLQRAVDEIYHTCETDESTLECKEAILILENYRKEFTALINWIQLSKQLENTPPPDRPACLAWEVRKSSLGRGVTPRSFWGLRSGNTGQRSPCLVSVAIQCGSSDSGQVRPDAVEKHPVPVTEMTAKRDIPNITCVPAPRTAMVPTCDVVLAMLDSCFEGMEEKQENGTHCSETMLHWVRHKETVESAGPEQNTSDDSSLMSQAKVLAPSDSSKSSTKEPSRSSSGVIANSDVTRPSRISPATTPTGHVPPGARLAAARATKLTRTTVEMKPKTTAEHKAISYSSSLKSGQQSAHSAATKPRATEASATANKSGAGVHPQRMGGPGRSSSSVLSAAHAPTPTSHKPTSLSTTNTLVKSGQDGKSGSTLSLSSSSSGRSWADKVKGPSASEDRSLTKSISLDPIAVEPDDSEGWETVRRNKPRSRNSPPKKMLPHQAPSSQAMGVKRSPSAPVISAPAPCRVKTPRRSSAPLSSGPPSSRPAKNSSRSATGQQLGPKSATSMPSLVPQKNRGDTVAACKSTTAPSLGARSKSFLCPTQQSKQVEKAVPDTENLVKENATPATSPVEDATDKTKQVSEPVEQNKPTLQRDDPLQEEDISQEPKPMSPFEEDVVEVQEQTLEAEEMVHDMGLSWGDQMDCLEELELRTPGRALQMHEKLSCATRKRSLSETIQRHKEKQAKAQEQRERIREEKAQRCRDQSKKVEEKKAQQEELQLQRRLVLEKRLQRAAEKRELQLKNKVKRAHDEEEKVNEIAFINSLEAQNKRIDLLSREKDHEARLQDIQEERQRKQEEKAAKEAAAEERRKVLEAERQAKLLEIQEKRKLKDEKVQLQQLEKEKLRQSLLKQKEREREQRLTAVNAAQLAATEELQKKIQLKQEESARRHEENIEQIRQKAFELSVRKCSSNNDDAPHHQPYDTKKICSLCNVLIGSEVYLLSHLRGKKHQEAIHEKYQEVAPSTEKLESYNLKHIVDAPADQLDPSIALDRERQKAHRKRCKKLRHKMTSRGKLYEKAFGEKPKVMEPKSKFRLSKAVKEVSRCLSSQGQGPWDAALVSSLDRALGELERTLTLGGGPEGDTLRALGGLTCLTELLGCLFKSTVELQPVVPPRCLVRACNVLKISCEKSPTNCDYLVLSNRVGFLLDILVHRLNLIVPDDWAPSAGSCLEPGQDATVAAMLGLIRAALKGVTHTDSELMANEDYVHRLLDVVSYSVSIGTVDKLSQCVGKVRGSDTPQLTEFLVEALEFVACLACIITKCRIKHRKEEDSTQLAATIGVTQLAGSVSLLYGTLLEMGVPSGWRAGNQTPALLSPGRLAIASAAIALLNQVARLDLDMFQAVLGAEGMSLQLRHIASYLLWYCSHWEEWALLHQVVLLIGHFAVLSVDNQAVIQSGEQPTLLQLLCTLPFEYFSNPELTQVLFPTLVCCCFGNEHNRTVLEKELSPVLLANFVEISCPCSYKWARYPITCDKRRAECPYVYCL